MLVKKLCVPLNLSVSCFSICKMGLINIPTSMTDCQDLGGACLGCMEHNPEVGAPCRSYDGAGGWVGREAEKRSAQVGDSQSPPLTLPECLLWPGPRLDAGGSRG